MTSIFIVFAIVICGGGHVLRSRDTVQATVIEVVSHGFGLAAQLFTLVLIVPRCQSIFEGYGTAVPLMTHWLIAISQYCLIWWGPAVLLLVSAVTVDGIVFGGLHQNEETRPQARVLSGCVTGGITVMLLTTLGLLVKPLLKLLGDLS